MKDDDWNSYTVGLNQLPAYQMLQYPSSYITKLILRNQNEKVCFHNSSSCKLTAYSKTSFKMSLC